MDNKYEKPFNEENEILNRKMEIENNQDKQNMLINNEIDDNIDIELINNDKTNKILQLKDEDLENLELINELMNLWEQEEKRKIEYPILKEEKNKRNINFSNQKHKNEKSHKKTFSKKEFYFVDEFDEELKDQRKDFQDSFELEIGEKLSKKIKKNEIILID